MVFQIRDDILGIWGEEDITRKPIIEDLIRGKKTLPIIYALNGEGDDSREFRTLYGKKDYTQEDILSMVQLMENIGCKTYCKDVAAYYNKEVEEAFVRSGNLNELENLVRFVLHRQY